MAGVPFDAPRTFVVLGAAGGIGSELCRRLASRGGRLVLGGRNVEKLQTLARELDGVPFPLDATRSDQVDALFAKATELYGTIDGVAHCVGSILLKPAHLISDAEWAETVALNLTSAFYVVRAAAKLMTQGGSIVLVSSSAARLGLANHEAIAAAKAGVIGLTLSAGATYAPRGVRVNAIAPGLTRTPLTARLTGTEAVLKSSTAMHPLGRIGEPSDVAAAIEWLLDPAQSWVTGQIIGIDGGLASLKPR